MERRYTLTLITAERETELEHIDTFLDLDTPDGQHQLRRHFIYMACRAENEPTTGPTDRMTWLGDYTLLVHDPDHHEPALRYREV